MTVGQRLDQLEKRNKRLTVALTITVVAMAATGSKNAEFDTVWSKNVVATNEAGDVIVALGAHERGGGLVRTYSAKGKEMVRLTLTPDDNGNVTTYQPSGKALVALSASVNGDGTVTTHHPNGKALVTLNATQSSPISPTAKNWWI